MCWSVHEAAHAINAARACAVLLDTADRFPCFVTADERRRALFPQRITSCYTLFLEKILEDNDT